MAIHPHLYDYPPPIVANRPTWTTLHQSQKAAMASFDISSNDSTPDSTQSARLRLSVLSVLLCLLPCAVMKYMYHIVLCICYAKEITVRCLSNLFEVDTDALTGDLGHSQATRCISNLMMNRHLCQSPWQRST
jgi:hypothetical protein